MKFEHFAINVKEPQAIAQWFAEHLDMKIVRADDTPPHITFIQDPTGGVLIEMYDNPAGEFPDFAVMHPLTFHIAFMVDDMEADMARLVAAGAAVALEPLAQPNGDILAFLRDPWGNAVQLVQRVVPLPM